LSFPPECLGNSTIVFAFRPRQPALILHKAADLLSPGVIMPQISDPAVRSNERPHYMPVIPTFLSMADTAAVCFGEAKLTLVKMKEALHHGRWIGTVWGWVDVNVMDRAICPAMRRSRNQLTELSTEIGGRQAPGFHDLHLLASLPGQEVAGKRGATLSSGGARDHAPSS